LSSGGCTIAVATRLSEHKFGQIKFDLESLE
jgi:hypothetical protein